MPEPIIQQHHRDFMDGLTRQVLSDYGITCKIRWYGGNSCNFRVVQNNGHREYLITYGETNCASHYAMGFREYATVRYVWWGMDGRKGNKALWSIALHECAHAIQEDRGYLRKGAHHDKRFCDILFELIGKYLYSKVAPPWTLLEDAEFL